MIWSSQSFIRIEHEIRVVGIGVIGFGSIWVAPN
jgi:hypothetical protein